MTTRRSFLKIIAALGAVALPWTVWPARLKTAIKTKIESPQVKLYTPSPPSQSLAELLQAQSLNRTLMDDILSLTAPEMEGRRAGSVGEGRASQFLIKEMKALGLIPMGEREGSYAHVFTIPPVKASVIGGRLTFTAGPLGEMRTPSMNLLGGLIGEKSEEVILLSAHYDHLGVYEGEVYPGANDNASGVACVLEVLRRLIREDLRSDDLPQKTIVFAFWSAEEMGFVGSQAFVNSPTFPLKRIQAVINVDTIGNGNVGEFALWSEGEGHLAYQAIRKAVTESGASAIHVPGQGHNSDQVSFAQVGISAVTLMAKDWLQNNHSPQDTAESINLEQVQLASEIVYRAVKILAYS